MSARPQVGPRSPAAPASPPARSGPRRTPGSPAVIAALLRKDLLVELRARESVPAMALFSVTTFVIFHFGLNRTSVDGALAAGVFWVTLLFAAVLGINRLFVAEREQGGFEGFLLAPIDRTTLLVAKAAALYCFLVVVEVVAVPAFALLLLGPSPWPGLPGLLAVLALGNLGLAVIGTLVSAIAIQTRARELIVPLLGLPLLVPALIAATQATRPLWERGGGHAPAGQWLAVLALYDAVFALLAYALFDFLLDD